MKQFDKCSRCGGRGKLPTKEALKLRRERTGASLRRIAALMDVSPSFLSLLENGKHAWTAKQVARFETALGQAK